MQTQYYFTLSATQIVCGVLAGLMLQLAFYAVLRIKFTWQGEQNERRRQTLNVRIRRHVETMPAEQLENFNQN